VRLSGVENQTLEVTKLFLEEIQHVDDARAMRLQAAFDQLLTLLPYPTLKDRLADTLGGWIVTLETWNRTGSNIDARTTGNEWGG
jgi:hypothetical protein